MGIKLIMIKKKIINYDKEIYNIVTWRCPKCGHIITDIEYKQVKYDYQCPGYYGKCEGHLIDYVPFEMKD